eukprot:2047446-Pyramimonas_sp.AAC.1
MRSYGKAYEKSNGVKRSPLGPNRVVRVFQPMDSHGCYNGSQCTSSESDSILSVKLTRHIWSRRWYTLWTLTRWPTCQPLELNIRSLASWVGCRRARSPGASYME